MSNGKMFATLQMIGRSFFLPISILPVAGLLLGIGASFSNPTTIAQYGLEGILGKGMFLNYVCQLMTSVGVAVFANLPLIFAMAVALGTARHEKEVAVLTAALSFIVMHITVGKLLSFSGSILPDGSISENVLSGAITQTLGITTLDMGVFGGIVVGLGVGALHNRFYKIELPAFISFFGGVRFVPIVSVFAYIGVGVVCFFLWPLVQSGIFSLGKLVTGSGYVGTFIFGFTERALIPFGLHHIFYLPFWQSPLGGVEIVDGISVAGAQNIFFAELASHTTTHFNIEAARFLAGKFAFMMAGLPAAALAMYRCAKPENRKLIGGLLFSAALTSFLTGITEPIEFTFLFVAPFVYVVHCILAGASFVLMHMFDIAMGTTFSCGLIDFILYGVLPGNDKTSWIRAIPIFAAYFVIYYAFFTFAIRKWDLKTPGRGDDETPVLYSKADFNAKQALESCGCDPDNGHLDAIIDGLGGEQNIITLDCCATRLRVTVLDPALVDECLLTGTGCLKVFMSGKGVQVVYGPKVTVIKSNLDEHLKLLRT